jgi:hypothetical protein
MENIVVGFNSKAPLSEQDNLLCYGRLNQFLWFSNATFQITKLHLKMDEATLSSLIQLSLACWQKSSWKTDWSPAAVRCAGWTQVLLLH